LISRYQDGELGRWRRGRLERHLDGCVACGSELEVHRRVWAVLEAAVVPKAPDVFGSLEALLDREQFAHGARRPWRFAPVAYAAAVLLFVAAGSLGGVYAAERRKTGSNGAADSEYAEFLGDAPAGLAPVASLLQPMRTQ
jgi:anti-sigma factor RsiW